MELTHTDESGKIKMVDVIAKEVTERIAIAKAKVLMNENTISAIIDNNLKKGDVLTTAKLAGIMAAKKTSELIPLCHNIFIDNINIETVINEKDSSIDITATAKTNSKTGIEMEAITAVSIAAITIYDMCKAIDKSITINNIHLAYKSGGKSGEFINEK